MYINDKLTKLQDFMWWW